MSDMGCNWFCDSCGACMNDQPGFSAGGSWECAECGEINNVTEDNILEEDDGYIGSADYYRDEEKRLKEEEWEDFEMGIVD